MDTTLEKTFTSDVHLFCSYFTKSWLRIFGCFYVCTTISFLCWKSRTVAGRYIFGANSQTILRRFVYSILGNTLYISLHSIRFFHNFAYRNLLSIVVCGFQNIFILPCCDALFYLSVLTMVVPLMGIIIGNRFFK